MRDSLLAAGLANQHRGRFQEAEQCYRVVLAQRPQDPDALYRMGVLALQCANAQGAVHYLRAAAQVRPLDADGAYNLGMAFALDYRFDEARACFEQALARDAEHASAAIGLGNVCKFLGDTQAAARAYLAAVASPRIGPTLFSQLLVSMHTNAAVDAAVLFDLHREWARRFAQPVASLAARFENDATPDRRLRIGFVSPSFDGVIVGHFLRGVLRALAQLADVYAYDAGTRRDWATAELRDGVVAWRDIAALAPEAVADLVRRDAIDVLVDLAGHAPGHRLLVFARRAAPVQMTWLDYFDTTGLDTMDVIVSDPVSTPDAALASGAQRFVERVARLPHARLCYTPPPYLPAIARRDPAATKPVVFGCFGRADKLDDEVIRLWADVLHAAPGSTLLLKNAGFDIAPVRARVLERFESAGIEGERIAFRGPSSHAQLLAEYADVDVALDTFPYNGGATTCDALVMGVPVVTLAGAGMIARQGAALLDAAGYADWIASSAQEYVAIAANLVGDRGRLAAIREGLRDRLLGSPLCDATGFARDFEAIAREAWTRFCAGTTVGAAA